MGGLLIQLSAAAGYQISYAVYVSDYSRYLPQETPSAKVIFWTYLGAAGSALWLMSLGAFLASALPAPMRSAAYRRWVMPFTGVWHAGRADRRPLAGRHHGGQLLWRNADQPQRD